METVIHQGGPRQLPRGWIGRAAVTLACALAVVLLSCAMQVLVPQVLVWLVDCGLPGTPLGKG